MQSVAWKVMKIVQDGEDGLGHPVYKVEVYDGYLPAVAVGDKLLKVGEYLSGSQASPTVPVAFARALLLAGMLKLALTHPCVVLIGDGGGENLGLGPKKETSLHMAGKGSSKHDVFMT